MGVCNAQKRVLMDRHFCDHLFACEKKSVDCVILGGKISFLMDFFMS